MSVFAGANSLDEVTPSAQAPKNRTPGLEGFIEVPSRKETFGAAKQA
jgi:hypothetical protein